ncbi:MAG: glycosyltransferase family 39 protein [Candidatus Daviesbacteria bacterium]|nr:MAG: glycosyltransferase family 39 protein [Candidatus Daviesbacteria bacterium]
MKKLTLLICLFVFILGLVTLPHYGINWDTINHLPRGQAYLHYFLTGRKDYNDLPSFQKYYQNPETLRIDADKDISDITKRSYYQNDSVTFETYMKIDGDGHPPISDILSAGFNLILFQKLHLINDVDSYRVYGVLLASLLVGLVFFWTSKIYGKFAGFVAALSLITYPLFFSEMHFNTEKDIPESFYWSLFLFLIWYGVKILKAKWILFSGLVFGLGLGTKFNILFSSLVIAPWFLVLALGKSIEYKKNILNKINAFLKISSNRRFVISLFLVPLVGFVIFLATWPYLWQDFEYGLWRVFNFYKTIGLTVNVNRDFLGPLGANTYPLLWIISTTPPLTLLLSLIGFIFALIKIKSEKDKVSLLILLWLLVPILRVIWPGATIYGGVRQIMEYIPALAILSGLGASFLTRWRYKKVISILILLAFIPVVIRLVQIHPNENVYFNFLTGGLSGAKEKQIPSWGNSFGSAYRQGVVWLNKNAPPNAEADFVYELMPNIPLIWVRPDILFHNSRRSGPLRRGDYAMTLTYDGVINRSYYDKYLEQQVNPVYETQVDGVAILKIWENDTAHTKEGFKNQKLIEDVSVKRLNGMIDIDLKIPAALSYLEAFYNSSITRISSSAYDLVNCQDLKYGVVSISLDGSKEIELGDKLPTGQIAVYGEQPKDGRFVYSFLGERARYIRLKLSPSDACLFNIQSLKVFSLPDVKETK